MKVVLPVLIASMLIGCDSPPGNTTSTAAAPAATAVAPTLPPAAADILKSWNDGAAKRAVVEFVGRVTREGGSDFVPVAERIATFDNDGTLWSEKPLPFQVFFAFDRVKALAPQHPEWKTKEPFASVLKGDLAGVAASGEKGVAGLMMATHTGMTTEAFSQTVQDWIATARHPQTMRLYTEMVYQPMLELLAYLRANGFKTYIVSGGGVEFIRVISESLYGIPPEQVIGSSIKTKYEVRNGQAAIVRLPEIDFIDDKAGKPVGIYKLIARRPIAAFGNSDGDFEMLEWTTSAPGARLGVIVHHDDDAREFEYDRGSQMGRLVRGLDEGPKRGWTIISIRNDWKAVYSAPR